MKPAVLFLSILLAVICSACAWIAGEGTENQPLQIRQSEDFHPLRVNSIAIAPLAIEPSLKIPEIMTEQFTHDLVQSFSTQTSMQVARIRQSESEKLKELALQPKIDVDLLHRRAALAAKQLGVPAVLCGVVQRFAGELGGGRESRAAAEVQFRLWLIEAGSGKSLWTAHYSFKNQPLSENLLRLSSAIEHGLGYKTSSELLRQGFDEAAKSIEKQRRK